MSIVPKLVNPAVLAMEAYRVPPSNNMLKLDAMENPYTLPKEMIPGWLSVLQEATINRYPDADSRTLREKLRTVMEVPPGMEILTGNGSDELIQLIAMAVAGTDRMLMTPEPGFVMYRMISSFAHMQYRGIVLDSPDFSLSRETALAAIRQYQPSLVFIAYPNNPTGNLFDRKTIMDLIESAPGLVVIDEAYHAFAGATFMDCLPAYDNLLLLRTLSKSGLAGLRLGYLVGPAAWINELNKIRLPYNINVLTQKTAEFILDRYDILAAQAAQICHDRELLYEQLQAMEGVTVWPSRANFLLFRCSRSAETIYDGLKQRGILIRNLHGNQPALAQCLRVTVGTADENHSFVQALSELLETVS